MKIVTKLRIAVLVPVVIAVVAGFALGLQYYFFQRAAGNVADLRAVISRINNFNNLIYSYMLYREERPRHQFMAEHENLTGLLARIRFGDPAQQRLLVILQNDLDAMKDLFDKMVAKHERLMKDGEDTAALEAGKRLGGQLLATSSQTLKDGLALVTSENDRISSRQRMTNFFFFVLIVGVTIILTYLLAGTMKAISVSLTKIAKGVEIIAAGNREHRIGLTEPDELGELARSFDKMTAELQKREEQLRDSKETLQLAIEATNLGTFDYYPRTGKLLWADLVKRHFGLPPEAHVDYEVFLSGLHPEDRGRVHRIVQDVLRPGSDGIYRTEYRTVGIVDQKERWISAQGSVHFNDEHQPERLIGTTLDITERKRNEQEREQLIAALEHSNRELQRFAYISSHDLQEPLRTVASFVELFAHRYRGKIDEEADRYIASIVEGASRMSMLISDLLEYSRVITGEKPFATVHMYEVVDKVVTLLAAAIKEGLAVITYDNLPAVAGDESQLVQLMQNLIGNAIKFSRPNARPRVRISAVQEEDHWRFGVHDNGIGIEPQFHERVFVIFQRLHTREEFPGTGIGLALCRKIVERHGGRIWVESRPGEGSSFYFSLPGATSMHLKEEEAFHES